MSHSENDRIMEALYEEAIAMGMTEAQANSWSKRKFDEMGV